MTRQKTTTSTDEDAVAASRGKPRAARKRKGGQSQPMAGGMIDEATSSTEALTRQIAASAPRQTKAALLRARLSEPGGVSRAILMEATGWQAHTLRAALSGLRKTGLIVTRRRDGADTIYAIVAKGPVTTGRAGEGAVEGANPAAAATDDTKTPGEGAASALVPTEGATA